MLFPSQQLRQASCNLPGISCSTRPLQCSQQAKPGNIGMQCLLQASRLCQNKGPPLLAFHAIALQPGSKVQEEAASIPQFPAPEQRPGRSWMQLFSLRAPQKAAIGSSCTSIPATIEDMTDIVAANAPVFFFHPDEQYFPCTVEWFLERSRLVRVARGWRRRVLETLVDFGLLDALKLAEQQQDFSAAQQQQRRRRQFLQLELDPASRAGQPHPLDKIPIYAHVKQTLDPILGKRDGLEINYMKFLAYNGPYKLFHSLWVGALGAHDADWEHVTVRLTPDGKEVTGVYYSAHRHRDGMWRSADEVPLSEDRRPLAYIAENGHGSYPIAGTILRLFCVINDYTSDEGRKWNPEKVVLVSQNQGDALPSVVSRGSTLNGSTYPSPSSQRHTGFHSKVERQDAPWLRFEGKWGSSVEAPQRQEWFARAENPVSRTWLAQIFFPLLPGVESIWEPAVEEVEEAIQNLRGGIDEGMDVFKDAAEDVQKEVERSRKAAYKQWRQLVKSLEQKRPDDK